MDLKLNGKIAIVTGASTGIGFACSKALYEEGVSLVMVARDQDRLQQASDTIRSGYSKEEAARIVLVAGDMMESETVRQAVNAAIEHFGRIDILINNAGNASFGPFFELSDEAFLDAWQLKLLGYMRMVKETAPHMIKQRDGRIINIVGKAGRTPTPGYLPGSTANAAILNFTRGISSELAASNVRINSISPGATETDRVIRYTKGLAEQKGTNVESQRSSMSATIPIGHMVSPDEIAAMALLLVSDRVPSVTGTEIIIDGGETPGV
ncbi:3-oxoacyl-[acyl-carrier protein] reductase/bacilysin biosynthesis oxidoreductase BacG [Paenibacillus catalpae]|uniref:3-oxoacyl-[acyl-carrier protein] reductase/bacilysin biosynthesis oxidoreductase BacG n=1 Tax=Paenibacillus catalpae TaxID=1045775 RepID=A0A1I1TX53_9BACL|nr:SDR family NAD(P)-dependent oxidoreductase [Paenibacillus catalpae]SFD63162.1 3-oxoacyl-[acyl-carrier protein] reductase/bacilysin biosynthesis oxidoreductase BacG [Paenibacillus catalpae]